MVQTSFKIDADDVPGFWKNIGVGHAECRWLLLREGGDCGVVVKEDHLRAPDDDGGERRVEHEVDGGNQSLGPVLQGAERSG